MFKVDRNAANIIERLQSNGFEAYLVGGCVRDMLLHKTPHDWDICTSATPDEIKNTFSDTPNVLTGEEYGTVSIIMDNIPYEVTTYRIDGTYSDGRHPDSVKFTTNLKKDLSRRDFTINAMAYDPVRDELTDPFGGWFDLQDGIIKCVGNPYKRFREDPLRILRAIRFSVQLYDPMQDNRPFGIDRNTVHAMHEERTSLNRIAKERITDEFHKMFGCARPVKEVFIAYVEIFKVLIPELDIMVDYNQNNPYHPHDLYLHSLYTLDGCRDTGNSENNFIIRMAALFHDIGKPNKQSVDVNTGTYHFYEHPNESYKISRDILSKRFRLSNDEYEEILNLIHYHDKDIRPNKRSVLRALNKHGERFLNLWFVLKQSDMDDHVNIEEKDWYVRTEDIKKVMQEVLDEEQPFRITDLHIDGRQVMKVKNLKPSKKVGEYLEQLLNAVMNLEINNTNEELHDYLRALP